MKIYLFEYNISIKFNNDHFHLIEFFYYYNSLWLNPKYDYYCDHITKYNP